MLECYECASRVAFSYYRNTYKIIPTPSENSEKFDRN